MSILNKVPWAISSSIPGKDFIRSIGEDLILIKQPFMRAFIDQPFRTESYVLLLCTRGHMEAEVNMVGRELNGSGMILMRPGQVIEFKAVSKDFQMMLVIASYSFLSKMDLKLTEALPLSFLAKMQDNPIIKLHSGDTKDVMAIFNLIFRLARNVDNPYRDRSILSVVKAFFYESGYYIIRNNPDILVPTQNTTAERLQGLISKYFRQHRDVEFYAEKLSLSPNYLYKVMMSASGRSVRTWIEIYVVTEAKAMLRDSSMTIQQIAEELNFPSQTFFGKYFKRVTGMSPNQYRKTIIS